MEDVRAIASKAIVNTVADFFQGEDIQSIRNQVLGMIEQGRPEEEISTFVKSKNVTPEQIKAAGRPKNVPFTPLEAKQYEAILRNPKTTPEFLNKWFKAIGKGEVSNAKELIDFVRNNPKAKITDFYREAPAPKDPRQEAFKMGVRGLATGAGSLVDLAAGPINALVNALPGEQGLSTTPVSDLANKVSDYLELPKPKTNEEKLVNAINEGGIQAVLTGGVGAVLSKAKGLAGAVGKTLAAAPATEIAASVSGSAAAEKVRQEGGGPVAQLAAAIAAGGTAGAAVATKELPEQTAKQTSVLKEISDAEAAKPAAQQGAPLKFSEMTNEQIAALKPRQKRALMAQELGYDEAKFLKANGSNLSAVQLEAGAQELQKSKQVLQELVAKNKQAGLTPEDKIQLLEAVTSFDKVNKKLTKTGSEAGKVFDVLAVNRDRKGFQKLINESVFKTDKDIDEFLTNFEAHQNNAAAQRKLIEAVNDPRAEDYVMSLWYNGLLSHPATHTVNMMGNASHLGLEGWNKGLAAAIGQVQRKADRVYGREVLGNAYGIVKALVDTKTYKNSRDAFRTQGKLGSGDKAAKVIMPKGLGWLETPSKLLNAEDEFWSSVIKSSSIYGQAAKIAAKEGKGYGKELFKRVGELTENPTQQMLDRANKSSDFVVFRDDPSKLAQNLEQVRSRSYTDTPQTRALKTVSKILVPFIQTPDRLIAATLRNSPAGFVKVQKIKAGGAEGQRQLARAVTGTALTALFSKMAFDGLITGQEPENYDKSQEAKSGDFQPYSIKMPDGSWVSYKGLDPLSSHLSAVATTISKYKNGELTDKDYFDQAQSLLGTIGSSLVENTYLDNIAGIFQSMESGWRGEAARTNLAANIAQSFTTPAIIRGINNEFIDKQQRDTTGDGSPTDRIMGRIINSMPVDSKSLPQKFDVYGRPMTKPETAGGMLTRFAVKPEEKDPVVVELQKLSTQMKSALVTPVSRNDLRAFKANSKQLQQYQGLSGSLLYESIKQFQNKPEWNKLDNVEKAAVVKKTLKAARKEARIMLFPEYYAND